MTTGSLMGQQPGDKPVDPSWQARLILALAPFTLNKAALRSEKRLRLALWLSARLVGPAEPSARLRRICHVTEETRHGAKIFTVAPRDPACVPKGPVRRILYFHGGGYVQHMVPLQWYLVRRLVEATGCTITVPHYTRPPSATAEAMLEQVIAIFGDLARSGTDDLAILGDSSGGGMAVAVSQMLRDRGLALASRLVLISPWLDVRMDDPRQIAMVMVDPMLDLPGGQAAGRLYAGDLPLDDPRVSPILGSFADLPPMLLLSGTRDILDVDARRLAEKAQAQGAKLSFRQYPGMYHVWPATPVPEAAEAVAEIAAFLRAP